MLSPQTSRNLYKQITEITIYSEIPWKGGERFDSF